MPLHLEKNLKKRNCKWEGARTRVEYRLSASDASSYCFPFSSGIGKAEFSEKKCNRKSIRMGTGAFGRENDSSIRTRRTFENPKSNTKPNCRRMKQILSAQGVFLRKMRQGIQWRLHIALADEHVLECANAGGALFRKFRSRLPKIASRRPLRGYVPGDSQSSERPNFRYPIGISKTISAGAPTPAQEITEFRSSISAGPSTV